MKTGNTMTSLYPVKPVTGILAGSDEGLKGARLHLEELLGTVDFQSRPASFSHTGYYVEEMGLGLKRWFLSFENLIEPDRIVEIKEQTMQIEDRLSVSGKRTVNIDPGYLDYHKLVLASTKYGGQKIYLGSGIWADITLFYSKGMFHAPEWSFPDFRTGIYDKIFLDIRMLYKQGLKKLNGDA
ncbi:DUF4416 family protein [Acidobacteriota bacterium]